MRKNKFNQLGIEQGLQFLKQQPAGIKLELLLGGDLADPLNDNAQQLLLAMSDIPKTSLSFDMDGPNLKVRSADVWELLKRAHSHGYTLTSADPEYEKWMLRGHRMTVLEKYMDIPYEPS